VRRWATEGLDADARDRLLANRIFRVLADRLATTTDIIAAVRVAEWLEHDPTLTDFVVDTAPGRNGLELVRRPRALAAFLEGKLLGWLHRPHGIGARLLHTLTPIAGTSALGEVGELAAGIREPLHRVVMRLERAEACLRDPATSFLLITTVREDGVRAASVLRAALSDVDLAPTAVVVNRTIADVSAELATLDVSALGAEAETVVRYTRAYAEMQARVVASAAGLTPEVISLPAFSGLDAGTRLAKLTALGRALADHPSSSRR